MSALMGNEMGHMTLLVQQDMGYTGESIGIEGPSPRLGETRENDEGGHPVTTEPDSPQPTHSAHESRTQGTLIALINLLLSVALLLSLGAAWVFIPIARVPAVCLSPQTLVALPHRGECLSPHPCIPHRWHPGCQIIAARRQRAPPPSGYCEHHPGSLALPVASVG